MAEENLEESPAGERAVVPVAPTVVKTFDPDDSAVGFEMMEATIKAAELVEKFEVANNKILNFVIRRTYANDWVSHDKANTPIDERTANITSAAAERIAQVLGLQEFGRKAPIKIMDADHPGHYCYQTESNFRFGGREVQVTGIASTLNPFYSKAGGAMKDPKDIREDFLMRESTRDCVKQAVRYFMGLRRVPVLKLKELGYDISRIRYVNFQQGDDVKKGATAAPAEATEERVTGTIEKMAIGKTAKGDKMLKITMSDGKMLTWFGRDESHEDSKTLKEWQDAGYLVTLTCKRNGQYLNVVSADEGVPQ